MKKRSSKRLTTKESYEKKMEEALLMQLGKYFDEQITEANEQTEKSAPESLDQWVQELCRDRWGVHVVSKNGKLVIQKSKWSGFRKAAAFVFLLVGAVAGMVGTAKGLGNRSWKSIVTEEEDKVTVRQLEVPTEENAYAASELTGYYYPSYVPEGYELVEGIDGEVRRKLVYTNQTDKIMFYCFNKEIVLSMDKEQEVYGTIQIEDKEGYFAVNKQNFSACICLEEYTILIFFDNILEDEVIKIIKSVKK